MRLYFAILAGVFFILPAHNLNAQGAHSLNMAAQQKNVPGAFLNRQAPRQSRLNKLDAPTSQIYLPDSLTLYSIGDTIRMSAAYNVGGWNDQIVVQILSSGRWVNYSRQTWTYLGSNENNLTLQQTWLHGQWTNVELDSSTYDARDNMLVHLTKYWSQGAWKDSLLSSRTYDANGNMLTNIGWVLTNSQWTNSWLGTYTYDASGDELTFLVQTWSGTQWVNMDMWTYTYDVHGHMLTELMQVYNGQWDNATLSIYTYDATGNMLSHLAQTWASGQWTNSTIHTYTYDTNGRMLTDWLKGWTNAAWMNGSLYTYTYDTNGNLLNELVQYWLNGLWTNFNQFAFTYDAHGNELTGNNTSWSGSVWMPTDDNFVLAVNGSTYDFTGYRIIVSWIPVNTADVPTNGKSMVKGYSLSQNYPNPFNPSTTIGYQLPTQVHVTLKVFDVLGREIATLVNGVEQPGYKSVNFNANNLASGVYYYRLQAGNYIETRKLLLLR
jgi:hypothetical protein